jgi:23S rRNA pseudouridine2457 synthase
LRVACFDIPGVSCYIKKSGEGIRAKPVEGGVTEEAKRGCLSRVAGRQPLLLVLEAAGAGPRSRCAGMVRGGRIAINGRVVRDLQARADPFRDQITLDDHPLPRENACRYLLLNKPYGVLCSFTDPEYERGEGDKRPTLADYVHVPGVYPAGRLDLDSEGLVLLTDDGWLIHRLAHPRYQHPKTYLVQVERIPDAEALATLRQGVTVKGQRTAPAEVEYLPVRPDLPPRSKPIRARKTVPTAWLRIVLTEGRKRQVRHMTATVGHPTLRLVRVGIGPLEVGTLQPGEWRDLTLGELDALRGQLLSPRRRTKRR